MCNCHVKLLVTLNQKYPGLLGKYSVNVTLYELCLNMRVCFLIDFYMVILESFGDEIEYLSFAIINIESYMILLITENSLL